MGMSNYEFRRCRQELALLKDRFLEERKAVPRTREFLSSLEIPMQPTTKVFLREELYERVWTTPMHRLAKEFGYSDVGLAKLCEKHNIPRPGLGYWRRLELGQKPERPPLPVVEQPNPYQIEIAIRKPILPDGKVGPREAPTVAVRPIVRFRMQWSSERNGCCETGKRTRKTSSFLGREWPRNFT